MQAFRNRALFRNRAVFIAKVMSGQLMVTYRRARTRPILSGMREGIAIMERDKALGAIGISVGLASNIEACYRSSTICLDKNKEPSAK